MDGILNELSLGAISQGSIYEAREKMSSLVATVAAARSHSACRTLRTEGAFMTRQIATDYTVAHWLNDSTVDREERRLIAALATKAPYLEELLEERQSAQLSEFTFQGVPALGLGVAALRNEPCVSVSVSPWTVDPLHVKAVYVAEHLVEEIQEEVCSLYSPRCLERRSEWIQQRLRQTIESGSEMLRAESGLFDGIVFTSQAREQIGALTGGELQFQSIVRIMATLARRARSWKSGNFVDELPLSCSPESEATLAKYGGERTVVCPDGVSRTFTWHAKIGVGAWRIYFHAQTPGAPVVVGYVGKHLKTVTG